MRARQQGFTLIELVVVIVILGILAAVAIPRYANYVTEARRAALNGLAGSIRSAVAVVQGRYMLLNNPAAVTVTMQDATVVNVSAGANGGIPLSTAGGIDAAVNVGPAPGTFTYTAGAATGTYNFPTAVAGCNVVYTAATGQATVNGGPC